MKGNLVFLLGLIGGAAAAWMVVRRMHVATVTGGEATVTGGTKAVSSPATFGPDMLDALGPDETDRIRDAYPPVVDGVQESTSPEDQP